MSGSPFELVFQENPVFLFERAEHCTDCSRVTDPATAAAPADMEPPTFDISVSLDGAIIVTDTFRALCADVAGVAFGPIEGVPGCWLFTPDHKVRVDPFDSHIKTGPICATCGEPRYVIRTGPLHLNPREPVPPGFSRTDIVFGDTADFGSSQPVLLRPHVLIDRRTGKMLKGSGLLGIHLIAQPEPDL